MCLITYDREAFPSQWRRLCIEASDIFVMNQCQPRAPRLVDIGAYGGIASNYGDLCSLTFGVMHGSFALQLGGACSLSDEVPGLRERSAESARLDAHNGGADDASVHATGSFRPVVMARIFPGGAYKGPWVELRRHYLKHTTLTLVQQLLFQCSCSGYVSSVW